ncbi:hypothetical protein ACQCN2_18370 [Brevibacillus ginsengisoli]|uniref:hypothetical protein n=1 Tax=Brevibacillus ginsengisoli TaxID=363854 RepID=UPI003CECE13C
MSESFQANKGRPDTSKNGRMKKNQLQLKDEAVRERGRSILSRLGKTQSDKLPEKE